MRRVTTLRCAYLSNLHLVDPMKHGVQQGNAVDHKLSTVDVDTVTDIVRMLDEQENARSKELLGGGGKNERQGQKSSTCGRDDNDEAAAEKRHYKELACTQPTMRRRET